MHILTMRLIGNDDGPRIQVAPHDNLVKLTIEPSNDLRGAFVTLSAGDAEMVAKALLHAAAVASHEKI